MSLTAPVLCVLLFVAVSQAMINYGNFGDNILRYIKPLECGISYSGKDVSAYVPKHRDCCYQHKTRNDCCLSVDETKKPDIEFSCKCDSTKAVLCVKARSATTNLAGEKLITGTPESLCRDLTKSRILGSKPVPNNCTYAGIARIVTYGTDDPICNAVYSTVYIDGEPQNAFVTPKACIPTSGRINLEFAGFPYAIPTIAVDDVNKKAVGELITRWEGQVEDNGFVYLMKNEPYFSLFSHMDCHVPACVYNDTMLSDIDFGNCKMISYGDTKGSDKDKHVKLREAKVYLDPFGCATVNAGENTGSPAVEYSFWCFKAVKDSHYDTLTDGGAAVYCKAKSNNEDILVGIASYIGGQDTVSEIPVLMLKYKFQ